MEEIQFHCSVGSAASNFHVSFDIPYNATNEEIQQYISRMLYVWEYGVKAKKSKNV